MHVILFSFCLPLFSHSFFVDRLISLTDWLEVRIWVPCFFAVFVSSLLSFSGPLCSHRLFCWFSFNIYIFSFFMNGEGLCCPQSKGESSFSASRFILPPPLETLSRLNLFLCLLFCRSVLWFVRFPPTLCLFRLLRPQEKHHYLTAIYWLSALSSSSSVFLRHHQHQHHHRGRRRLHPLSRLDSGHHSLEL